MLYIKLLDSLEKDLHPLGPFLLITSRSSYIINYMTIHYKTFPDSLDIVFSSHNQQDNKAVHAIMRQHVTGYQGFRLNKQLNQVEIHSEVEPSAWTMERLYKDLEDLAYSHLYPKSDDIVSDKPADSLDDVSEH